MNFTTLAKYYLENRDSEALSLIFEEVGEMEASKRFFGEFKKQIDQINLPQNTFLKVIEHLEKKEKIPAIKVLVEDTGLGLKSSKDTLDGIEAFLEGGALPKSLSDENSLQDSLEQEVKRLLSQNKVIEAVKYVHENTGLGLKGAKDFVDKLR